MSYAAKHATDERKRQEQARAQAVAREATERLLREADRAIRRANEAEAGYRRMERIYRDRERG